MKSKTKKIFKIVLNVFVYALFVLILLLTVLIVSSKEKGYVSLFGTAFVAVESDSMNGNREDSFKKGALLKIDVLSDDEKSKLKAGDIISFYDNVNGRLVINSHRIVEVWGEGNRRVFITQGDKEGVLPDGSPRRINDVIGKVAKRTNGLGNAFLFVKSSTGFVVCIVLPCLLLLSYCIYDVVTAVREQKKVEKAENKELLKEELLKELRAEGKIPAETETQNERKEKD